MPLILDVWQGDTTGEYTPYQVEYKGTNEGKHTQPISTIAGVFYFCLYLRSEGYTLIAISDVNKCALYMPMYVLYRERHS